MSPNSEEDAEEVKEYLAEQNPFDRVKRLYQTNPITNAKYIESVICNKVTFYSSTLVGTIVFIFAASDAQKNYLAANTHTIFKTKWLARRRASDAYVLGGLKRGGKWMLITGLAVSSFSYMSQAIELYRLKTSTANYAASGAILGGLSRVLLGPRGMFAGAFIGGYSGILVGFSISSYLRRANVTVEQRFMEEAQKTLTTDRFYSEYSAKIKAQMESLEESSTSSPVKVNAQENS